MTGNTLIGNGTATGGDGVHVSSTTSVAVNLQMTGNTIQNSGLAGVSLCSGGSGQLNANISGSTVSDNAGAGITANSAGGSTLALTVTGNTINHNGADGVVFAANDQSNGALTMTGNTLITNGTKAGGDGVHVSSTTSGAVNLQMTGNPIQSSGLTGIEIVVGGGAFTGTSANNNVSNSSTNGISVVAISGSTNVSVHDNTIANSGGVGLVLTRSPVPSDSEESEGSSGLSLPAMTASAANNTITGSGRQGIYVADRAIFTAPTTPFTVDLTNNHTSGNQGAGISLTSVSVFGNSNLVAHVEGNTLTGDNAGCIDSAAFQAAVQGVYSPAYLGLRLTGNTATAAKGDAFRLSNSCATFILEDGGQNVPATFSKVGTITPGIVP